MNRTVINGILTVACSLGAFSSFNAAANVMIKVEIPDKKIYQFEHVPVTVMLYSSGEILNRIGEISPIGLSSGEFSSVRIRPSDGIKVKKEFGGVVYEGTPIYSFIVSFDKADSYTLSGGEYRIECLEPDPDSYDFFGRQIVKSDFINLEAPKTKIKVNPLPPPKSRDGFSGAVGDFNVSVDIQSAPVVFDEEAVVTITVQGEGSIPKECLPNYENAFRDGVKLKSVSETRNEYWKDGKLITVLKLDCFIIPSARNKAEIGTVQFDFFDPSSGKYLSVSSDPVVIDVKSSTVYRDAIDV